MPETCSNFAEPLLHPPHSARHSRNFLTFGSLLIGLGIAVSFAEIPWAQDKVATQGFTIGLFSRFQPLGIFSNALSPYSLQVVPKRVQPPQRQVKARFFADTWQTRLDKALLDVDVDPRERLSLLSQAVSDPGFPEDVRSAVSIIQEKGFGKGHPEVIEKLWPKGTNARADLEGLSALRKQVPEVLQDVQTRLQQSPTNLFPQVSGGGAATLPDPAKVLGSLASLASNREKQNELVEETKDLLRSTPKGLETPQYKVLRVIDGPMSLGAPEPIELRKYEEFSVARTSTEGGGFTSTSGASGFNTLASYLFGKNEAKQEMAMTMPVEMTSSTDASYGSMAFVLPKEYAKNPPAPLESSGITIDKVPVRLVAAKPFPGIVTDEEVARQKKALLEALAADVSIVPVGESQAIVLQYNSPLTVPWRRRNEVAIVVTEKAVESLSKKLEIDSLEGMEKRNITASKGEDLVVEASAPSDSEEKQRAVEILNKPSGIDALEGTVKRNGTASKLEDMVFDFSAPSGSAEKQE